MYEQSYGHDFDSSQLSNLSRTGGNRLWSENPRRQRCRDSSTSNLSLSPLYLRSEFGLLWSSFFSFFHSSNPKLPCHTLDTFVQMSSLLHKRQEDPWQPGGQEPWKTDLRTWTSSASWIIFHELTSLVSTCDVAKQFPSSSKRGWAWLWHVRR